MKPEHAEIVERLRKQADAEYLSRKQTMPWMPLVQAADLIESLAARLEAIEKAANGEDPIALIEAGMSLPKTADGVRVTPGMPLYEVLTNGRLVTEVATMALDDKYEPTRWCKEFESAYFSTPKAAEAARAEQ